MSIEEMKREFYKQVEDNTPDYIKKNKLIDLSNKDKIIFTLKKERLEPHSKNNPSGLGLKKWLENYKQEAMISTGGIRGVQNILYPWDTRYPLNMIGIMLATYAKAKVFTKKYPNKTLNKICSSEVRYNSKLYVELIARVQSQFNIITHTTKDMETMPVWMASYIIFKEGFAGGEYVTSSHAISKKIATKDLNFQGSQYLPEESMEFIREIESLFEQIEKEGSADIIIGPRNHKNITHHFLESINQGIDMYSEYLRKGVATKKNLERIRNTKSRIFIDTFGGCMYRSLDLLFKKLEIRDKFEFLHKEEDPFFHGIGKLDYNPKTKNKEFFDLSCDASIMFFEKNKITLPVVDTIHYEKLLKNEEIGTLILLTDPDGDRLLAAQIEPKSRKELLDKIGVVYAELDKERILSLYTPNQLFMMTIDFQYRSLKESKDIDKYDYFMIRTTPSAMSWQEWADKNNIPVINVPVGFKEIATILKKVEKQIMEGKEVVIRDVMMKDVKIGKNPRLLFAGEQSGGEVIGPNRLIESKTGRKAIAMREKSAGEAIVISSAMVGYLETRNMVLSDYLKEIFEKNNIKAIYDGLEEISYYNESEPDIVKLLREKEEGDKLKVEIDKFFLSIALGIRDKKIDFNTGKEILKEKFQELDFSKLRAIEFVGDGTYLDFEHQFVEIRPSGTDAKTRILFAGSNKEEVINFSQVLKCFDGKRNTLHKKKIEENYYKNIDKDAKQRYLKWVSYQEDTSKYIPPSKT